MIGTALMSLAGAGKIIDTALKVIPVVGTAVTGIISAVNSCKYSNSSSCNSYDYNEPTEPNKNITFDNAHDFTVNVYMDNNRTLISPIEYLNK